jgi:hypothetical protein
MQDHDAPAFEAMLADFAELHNKPRPSDGVVLIYWAALEPYPWPQVRAAFGAHVCRCSFMPKPHDLIEILEAHDGRPSAEEAWAVAIQAHDEGATVVWTHETSEAWGTCRPLLDTGDQVAARMTFKDAYNRLVAEARRELRPVAWATSLGTDAARREAPLRQAVALGLIPADMVTALLPPPVEDTDEAHEAQQAAKLLTGKVADWRDPRSDAARRFRAAVLAGLAQARETDRQPAGLMLIPETDADRELATDCPWAFSTSGDAA